MTGLLGGKRLRTAPLPNNSETAGEPRHARNRPLSPRQSNGSGRRRYTAAGHPMSAPDSTGEITRLLRAHHDGDREAFDRLVPLVYERMRRIARGQLAREGRGHTLSPTALVHEAYQQLVIETGIDWQDRSHFYGICGRAMRRILVDYARMRKARKRGGALPHVPLDTDIVTADSPADVILAVDRAVDR